MFRYVGSQYAAVADSAIRVKGNGRAIARPFFVELEETDLNLRNLLIIYIFYCCPLKLKKR